MMKCPKCKNEIRCKVSIKTEDAERPIETSYQWWYCESCGAKYTATLEDSNVNMFDDRLRHDGYAVDEAKWQEQVKWADKCPKQNDTSCKCEVHKGCPPAGFWGAMVWSTYD